MRTAAAGWVLALALLAASPALALDAASIARKTKAALEPDRPSAAQLTVRVYRGSRELAQWSGAQARSKIDGANCMLTVFLTPQEVRGMAMLSRQRDGQAPEMWVYLPATHRVQKLSPTALSAPFFGTDFTFADLGFMRLRQRYKLLGVGEDGGVKVYRIEGFPDRELYGATSVIAWIDQSTFLPVRREFFSYDRHPWRIETYSHVKYVQGVPTVTQLRMEDKTSNDSTVFDFSNIRYDNKAPDQLFDPDNLGQAAYASFWSQLAS
jgi:Outer membrane lipoprotein-sorting protein